MELAIKNMVCRRCVTAVEQIMEQLHISNARVSLGSIRFGYTLDNETLRKLDHEIEKIGFKLIFDHNENLVKNIKTLLIELLQEPITENYRLSAFLSDKLSLNYQTLAGIFSSIEQITIEKYFINLKIEKVKELLSYNDLSIKEIAYQLNYSSTAHLSKQFKEVVGMSPSVFKNSSYKHRLFLDDV